jgi:glycosyltransferase involved in cell wall biosynthesis
VSPAPGPAGRSLVVCSLEPWDEVWRRNQFLVAGLLRRDPELRVLFVEPPADPVYEAASRRRPRRGRGLVRGSQFEGRLVRLQLTKWVPRKLWPGADAWLARRVQRAAVRLGLGAPVLWVNDPNWVPLLLRSGWPALYDITDDWVEADRNDREHDRLVGNEDVLMRTCGEVVVCSPGLAATKGAVRRVELVPNGVELARYRTPVPRPADLPEHAALYVGTLHEDRLDVDLVRATAEGLAAAGSELVLVGPVALATANVEALSATPGVRLLGARPNSQVPAYLQHAGALVVPHVVNAFTESLDPIKVYEYLAVGRPIVSTPVAGFRDQAGQPGVAVESGPAFVAATVAAARSDAPTVDRGTVADWDDRVTAMQAVLDRLTG